jgi:hypothetical protein
LQQLRATESGRGRNVSSRSVAISLNVSGVLDGSAENSPASERFAGTSCLLLWCALRGLLNRTPEWQAWVYDKQLCRGRVPAEGNSEGIWRIK